MLSVVVLALCGAAVFSQAVSDLTKFQSLCEEVIDLDHLRESGGKQVRVKPSFPEELKRLGRELDRTQTDMVYVLRDVEKESKVRIPVSCCTDTLLQLWFAMCRRVAASNEPCAVIATACSFSVRLTSRSLPFGIPDISSCSRSSSNPNDYQADTRRVTNAARSCTCVSCSHQQCVVRRTHCEDRRCRPACL